MTTTSTLLPRLVTPATGDDRSFAGLLERVEAERTRIASDLAERGAVLFRDYAIGDVETFDSLVRAVAGDPLEYTERSSPRSAIRGRIYTSTDYPASEPIFLHNENSYQTRWPMRLLFFCVTPPESLGATPLAGTRAVLAAIDPAVREAFERRGWMVVRNFHPNVGPDWRTVFGTEDREAVERYCSENDIEVEWRGEGLRTRARRRAVHHRPGTGEAVWFNHLTFFHVTTLPGRTADGLRAMFDEPDLPTNTYYGDGEPVGDETLDHLRECYAAATHRFDYRRDDVLLVDNMLTAHGREPYTGARRIAVAMAEPSP